MSNVGNATSAISDEAFFLLGMRLGRMSAEGSYSGQDLANQAIRSIRYEEYEIIERSTLENIFHADSDKRADSLIRIAEILNIPTPTMLEAAGV